MEADGQSLMSCLSRRKSLGNWLIFSLRILTSISLPEGRIRSGLTFAAFDFEKPQESRPPCPALLEEPLLEEPLLP